MTEHAERLDRLRQNLIESSRYILSNPQVARGYIAGAVLEIEVIRDEMTRADRAAEFDALMVSAGTIEVATEAGTFESEVLKTVADFPTGTELNKCGRCNALRFRAIPICPRCRCPEYELTIIDQAGEVVRQPTEEPARRVASR